MLRALLVFSLSASASAFASMHMACPTATSSLDCTKEFHEGGGCLAWGLKKPVDQYIPAGCDGCEKEAAEYCSTKMPSGTFERRKLKSLSPWTIHL